MSVAKKMIEEIAASHGITIIEIKEVMDVKKEGFLGNVSKIRVIGTDKNNKECELSMLVKAATKNEAVRYRCLIPEIFVREILMYDTIFPAIHKFQQQKGITPFIFAAKYFRHSLVDMEEAIVMENLCDDGFAVYDKRTAMDEDHVRIVMEAYGRFHAMSYAMRDQEPDLFRKLSQQLDNIYLQHIVRNKIVATLTALLTDASLCLDNQKDEECKPRYANHCERAGAEFERMVAEQVQYSVVLHADCWTNNMMFKYGNPNDPKPTEVRLIDFQFSRIGNPALDLAFYVYSCANENVLNHIEDYIQIYYRSLTATLQMLGSDPAIVPYQEIENYWKKSASYGLTLSSLLLYLSMAKHEELIDMNEASAKEIDGAKYFNINFSNKDLYLRRMGINIRQCIDKQYI